MTTAAVAEPSRAEDLPPHPPILGFVSEYPALFEEIVLARLDPIDRTVLAQVSHGFRVAVLNSDLRSPLLDLS